MLMLLIVMSFVAHGQFCPALGPNQNLPCGVFSTTLTADLSQCGPGGQNPNQTTNYSVAQIPYIPQTNTGNQLFMTDDSQQGPFNIGFNFCFYGQTYTQFWVGSNGWISFSGGQPTTFTSNVIPTVNALVPKNCIMGPWQDWHPGLGGQIRYQTSGVAPCRKLTVSWIGVPMFSCTGNQGTFHIVIYESTNYIENHIQDKPACLAWQGGTATQGIHNALGSAAIAVPGRNSTAWTTNNDSYRWTPSGPVVNPVLTWYQVGVAAPIGTGPSITVTPPPTGANYTCRFVYPLCNAGWSNCNANQGLGPDTVFVLPGPPNLPPPIINSINPTCNYTCDGSILINPIGTNGASTISWNSGSGFNPTNLCGGIYSYNIIDAIGCSVSGNVTLTTPPVVTTGPISASDTVCFGSNSELYTVPTQPGYTYSWSSVGNLVTGQGNDSVLINWTSFSGFIPGGVQVMATNSFGCNSLPVTFDLFVLQILPVIQPISSLCSYDDIVNLVAIPGGGMFSGSGVIGNQFDPFMANEINNISYIYSLSGCIFDTSLVINVYPRPIVSILIDDNARQFFEICEGDSVLASYTTIANPVGYNVWYFMGDTITQDNLDITWQESGSYDIMVVHWANGCVSFPDVLNVGINECPQTLIYIPNAFTPDGDELNNSWMPIFTDGVDPYDFNLRIFNRWGETIWETKDPSAGWDGTYKNQLCPEGIYQYVIHYGNLDNDKKETIHGHLTLMK